MSTVEKIDTTNSSSGILLLQEARDKVCDIYQTILDHNEHCKKGATLIMRHLAQLPDDDPHLQKLAEQMEHGAQFEPAGWLRKIATTDGPELIWHTNEALVGLMHEAAHLSIYGHTPQSIAAVANLAIDELCRCYEGPKPDDEDSIDDSTADEDSTAESDEEPRWDVGNSASIDESNEEFVRRRVSHFFWEQITNCESELYARHYQLLSDYVDSLPDDDLNIIRLAASAMNRRLRDEYGCNERRVWVWSETALDLTGMYVDITCYTLEDCADWFDFWVSRVINDTQT